MNILLVYPEFSETFWSWKYLLKLIGKKAAFPPLGLLTVAAMLPKLWNIKLVDLNVCKLTVEDIIWADYVFISAMLAQNNSTQDIIAHCNRLRVPVILGGPILEMGHEKFAGAESFFYGEVENTLQEFLEDLGRGTVKKIYPPKNFPNLNTCPVPLWGLVNTKDYACMLVQYGRGCPFRCTFCNIVAINGRVPRVKSSEQFLCELDAIYKTGFRGRIMFADDNLIGNKTAVREMLPWLIRWQQAHGYPFSFSVEVDIRIADEPDLMYKMVLAGFRSVFLGIETPNKASLEECGKTQNLNRDIVADVKKIHNHGLSVMSGFIIGFDADGPNVFEEHVRFYRQSGIVFPMTGILQVGLGTALHARLKKEGRLLAGASGNNTDWLPNFVTKMPLETLVKGYKHLWRTIYSPREYYERMRVFLRDYNTSNRVARRMIATDLRAFVVSIFCIGVFGGFETSYYYWKTLFLALFKHPRAFPDAVADQISGWHFRQIAESIQKS